MNIKIFEYTPVSMVTYDDLQRVNISYESDKDCHLFLTVKKDGTIISEKVKLAFMSGKRTAYAMLPVAKCDFCAEAVLTDKDGNVLSCESFY